MKIEVLEKRKRTITLVLLLIIVFCIISSKITDFNSLKGLLSIPDAFLWMITNFIPEANSFWKLPNILNKLIETILLSVAATTVAAGFALFFGVMGSKVTKVNGIISTVSRFIASVSRNVPDAVWAMIFLLSFGQNVLTGYFALFFVSFGVLTRAFIDRKSVV